MNNADTITKNQLVVFKQPRFYSKWLKFLFPYYPLHLYKSFTLMAFLAFLFALHIILVYVGFNLPVVNLQVGFDWIPTYLAGWFYGPIWGAIFGFVANNISWLQTGATYWYWMYAIQEPIIAIFASLVSYYCSFSLKSKQIKWDVIFQQLIFFIFVICTLTLISLCWTNHIQFNGVSVNNNQSINNLLVATMVIFSFFVVASETYILFKLKKHQQKGIYHLKMWLGAITVISSMIFLFAIVLGPITDVNYLYAFHFINNPSISKTLFLSDVIGQILLQCIRLPIAIIIFYLIIVITDKPYQKLIINACLYKHA